MFSIQLKCCLAIPKAFATIEDGYTFAGTMMKLDADIKAMSTGDLKQELQRIRSLVRTHKGRKGNARCWHVDLELYESVLPEGCEGAGKMNLSKDVLLKKCNGYIDRQQCVLRGCRGEKHGFNP